MIQDMPMTVENNTFVGENFSKALFIKHEFFNCVFEKCDFTDSSFEQASFWNCTFKQSNLSLVNLKKKGFIPVISRNKRRSKKVFEKTRSRHRWILERTHGHLNSWRGIFIRWNKKVKNYVAAICIAATFYTLRFL